MTIYELKAAIEIKTGIPAALISGTTGPEVFSSAKQLAAFKGAAQEETKTARAQFAEFAGACMGVQRSGPDNAMLRAVDAYESEVMTKHPELSETGTYTETDAKDSFAEWFSSFFAFDPSKY